ncbi:MAG: ferrous iron transporter B [Planctomycetota bacterium]|jgi:ferrous iron transport protein B|nr:ferrous iron transporter B [Planctomycetota bacterium]
MEKPASGPDPARLTVALLGNPNTGKSTLFSALAGIPTRVGNYPGVTVEEKLGRFSHRARQIDLIDLPGTYSLAPQGPDERVAVDVLHGRLAGVPRPEVVVVVADATNLERNLFLATQATELGLPLVVALTLCDIGRRRGTAIDTELLAERLGCPVIALATPSGEGLAELRDAIVAGPAAGPPAPLGLEGAGPEDSRPAAARDAIRRYALIERLLDGVVRRAPAAKPLPEDRIDRLLTHKLWGTLVFAAVMLVVFSSIFWLAAPLMDLISGGMEWLSARVSDLLPPGAIRDLVVDGVLAGIGGVVVFVPQIALLFLLIAVLEGCGYLARAAYLMDRLLVGVGLSGKSFIPLLSSFACAIPGIMAARTIENRRDRLLTILVAPLMSCSARLPVYLLLTGAFVPDVAVGVAWLRLPAVVLTGMYGLGVVVAAAVAWLLSRTFFRGPPQPFVMELPSWRWPQAAVVLERAREAVWSFLQNAGTLILAVSVVVWALSNYPRNEVRIEADIEAQQTQLADRLTDAALPPAERAELSSEVASLETPEGRAAARLAAIQRGSLLGKTGRFVEPLVRPLGWDWRIGCAAIASFPAREVVLGTLAVLYNLPAEEAEGTALERRLKAARWDGTGRPVFTLPVALSIMVFFALCAQCASTLVVIGRETGSWVWPVVTFTYMTVLAWLGAFATYQLGTWLGW